MKKLATATVLIITTVLSAFGQGAVKENFNVKKGVAIEGYDPVSYFQDAPTKGNKQYHITYHGVKYWFSTADNLSKFKADPEKYEPQYGGWCAYAMGESGDKVKIDPETYKIVDGKLYLFYNFKNYNTLLDWNKDEHNLQKKADQYWQKIIH